MSTPSADIINTTLQHRAKKLRDNLFRSVPLLDAMKQKGRTVTLEGGARISIPVGLSDHSGLIGLSGSGYTAIPAVTVGEVTKDALYEWSNFVQHITMSKVESVANKGPEARVRLLDAKMQNVFGSMRRSVETQIFAGSVAAISDLQSFNGLDAATGAFEEQPFGSQDNTVGGIAKASYPTAWQHQLADAAGAFATGGLAAMRNASIKAGTYGAGIDLVFLSTTAMGLYAAELQTQDRYVMERPADGARLNLQFDGASVFAQKDLGFTGSGGSNKLSGIMLDSSGVNLYVDREGNFSLSQPRHADGIEGQTWSVFCRMQVVFSALNVHAAIINAEA